MITGLYLLHYGNSYDLLNAKTMGIDIRETDKMVIRVFSSTYSMPSVTIGDYSLSLSRVSQDSNSEFVFESKESTPFRNFIGVSHIEATSGDGVIVSSIPLNVLARKMTYDKAASFLRYIVTNEDVSSACFSVTQGRSDSDKRTESIVSKINLGMNTLNYLKNEWFRFEKDPCTRKEVLQSIERYDRKIHLDDQAISFLSSHPDELSLSYDERADLRLSGRLYSIGNIVVNKGALNRNVYENQVIMSFLITFMSFLKGVKKMSTQSVKESKTELVSADGTVYMSLDRLMKDSGLIFDYSKLRVDIGIELCQKYIRVLREKFGCTIQNNGAYKPVPTHKVLLKPHYLNVFKLIHNYHAAGEPSWKGASDSYGLRSLPKIYEFVVLVGLMNSIIRLGFAREKSAFLSNMSGAEPTKKPINEINNYHIFSNQDGVRVRLFYDIPIEPLAAITASFPSGTPIDIKGYHAGYTFRPDYYLLIEKNGEYAAHILDAKYSTMENVKSFLLPQCAMKYGLQTRTLTVKNEEISLHMANSVIIACSEYGQAYQSITQRSTNGLSQEIKSLCPIKPEIGYLGVDENSEHLLTELVSGFLSTALTR